MKSHFAKPARASSIRPHEDALRAHVKAELAKGYSRSASVRSYCTIHGLHSHSVLQYCRDIGILTQRKSLTRLMPELIAHIKAGGNQKEFTEKHGFAHGEVCRMCKTAGYAMKLIHADEWAVVQTMRKGAR